MNDTILVNFHCHSVFSDGEQTPEALAANLSAAGVRYAALTDHDSLEGLQRFLSAAKKRGISCISGVEITTRFKGREAHLLGYGFDPDNQELTATLVSLRQVRELEVHSIAGSLRKIGANHPASAGENPPVSAAPDGQLDISTAIALLHRAGGWAFLAHPLVYEPDLEKLDACLADLKLMGLDGLEVTYTPFSKSQRSDLHRLAQKHGLIESAGTDFHLNNATNNHAYGVEMPRQEWIGFRELIFSGLKEKSVSGSTGGRDSHPVRSHRFRRRTYVLSIFLPTVIAISLFITAIWGFILPSFEQTLMDRKRELIRELTNSAWSILASYERDERNGLLTHEEVQAQAIERIEALRYGADGKDYFWIQDMQPRMIMHPYRPDLNGQDLENFTDPRGVQIFVEFTELVERDGEGYIDYVWQWNDDPQRLEPKQSYVKGFEPWGWIIGTGIYTDDVHDEIARIERNLVTTSVIISGAIILLLLFVLSQSLRIERERQEVLDDLRASTERYHTLLEATTEGTLLILEDRCRYANPIFLDLTGYTSRQLEFLELSDLLPREAGNQAIWTRLARTTDDQPAPEGEVFEGLLKNANGDLLECALAVNPIVLAGQRGIILLARDVARQVSGQENISHAAHGISIGIFRARAVHRAILLEMNQAMRTFTSHLTAAQPALADLFPNATEFELTLTRLQTDGEIKDHLLFIETADAATRILSLSAKWVKDELEHTAYIDGILEDVTLSKKQEANREALIEKLQTSLLFLHEPIARLGRDVVICGMDTTIGQLARLMTTRNVTAALVSSASGEMIGIITDHDLRARVLAEDIPPGALIQTVMSAPLTRIPEHALVYEALMRMEEKGVRHLAVEDQDGRIVSVIDNKSLIQFQRYGPIVLAREIARAATPEEVANCTERVPALVKALLSSSARPRHVTNMLASICDSATERLVQQAIEELGPPPAAFAFIAMGSQGRQEQTVLTDQDNGIIFAPTGADDPARVSEYFLQLGARVCKGLDRAGYPFCVGKVMASNPRWCRSLPDWISGFNDWIRSAEPQEIINLSIFFDFRTVTGDVELAHELRSAIHFVLANEPASFHHFAQNALQFKPPFRLLGNIYLSGGATERVGEINLKDAMMPIVSFARLYALRHQANQTHTLERIETLTGRNVILPASRDEIIAAYDFLMQLRLQNQIEATQAGRPPQNIIHPGKLGYIQQELLKQAFVQISAVQKKISYDFLGGTFTD